MDGLTLTSQVTPPASKPLTSVTDFQASGSTGAPANDPVQKQTTSIATNNTRTVEVEGETNTDAAQDVKDLIGQLEKLAASMHLVDNTRLSISFREDVNKFVYSGIDRDTGEVVTQYPSEEILNQLARYFELTGLAVDIES